MSQPDWERLLLAYADGELGPAERVHVERYLAAHPGAWDLLAELEETGPSNFELWDSVEPPEPSDDDWDRRSHAISALVPRQNRHWPKAVAASLVACAAVFVAVLLMNQDVPPPPLQPQIASPVAKIEPPKAATKIDPLAEFAVLPIATPDDVMVDAVRGNGNTGLVSVRPPLSELALATPDDVEVEKPGNAEVTEGDAAMMFWPKK